MIKYIPQSAKKKFNRLCSSWLHQLFWCFQGVLACFLSVSFCCFSLLKVTTLDLVWISEVGDLAWKIGGRMPGNSVQMNHIWEILYWINQHWAAFSFSFLKCFMHFGQCFIKHHIWTKAQMPSKVKQIEADIFFCFNFK